MGFLRKLYFTLQSVADHPLKRNAKWRAIRDFSVAQVAVRLTPGDVCVAFPNTTRLLVSPRMKGAAHFISPGLCEFEEMAFVTHFLRATDLFADVGANIGAYTVLASGVSGARTICFEPSPTTFQYLEGNVRLNNLSDRVTPRNAAVGRTPGRIRLTAELGTENYICPNGSTGNSVEVEVTTLDEAFGPSAPTLMKVDVEGYESQVFGGGAKTLFSPKLEAMVVERSGIGNRYGYDEEALHVGIRKAGFVPCSYSAFQRKISQIPDDALGNIIYVRNLEQAGERVRGSEAFHFGGFTI